MIKIVNTIIQIVDIAIWVGTTRNDGGRSISRKTMKRECIGKCEIELTDLASNEGCGILVQQRDVK